MTRQLLRRTLLLALLAGAALTLAAAGAWAQSAPPEHSAPAQAEPAGGAHASGEPAGEGEHKSEGLVPVIARFTNFALLAGTLVYFLRSPIRTYLADRKTQIRRDLVRADEMRTSAAAQIAAIENKMAALPAELEALRKAGAEEVAAEDARIRKAAEAERTRLLDQTRREIDVQLKIAERDLVRHAAELAVSVASARIAETITDEDQARLVNRYLAQVGTERTR